jgi:hypothetical protein
MIKNDKFKKKVIILLLLILFSLPLIAKLIVHPYSYLTKPPVEASIAAIPDKETYYRNEIINFKVIIQLDTLQAEKGRQYKLMIGNLGEILVASQLMKSDVLSSYEMNFEKNIVKMNFTVQMLQDDTPPNIKVEAIRVADDSSKAKRQYRNMVIDQYEIFFITSPKFRATK